MKAEIKKLYDEKGAIIQKMTDAARSLKEGKQLTADDDRQFSAWDGELKSVTDKIRILERSAQLEADLIANTGDPIQLTPQERFDASKVTTEKRTRVWKKAQLRNGYDGLSKEERDIYDHIEKENDAFGNYFRFGQSGLSDEEKRILSHRREQRAQSTTTTAGGYTIPEGFSYEIDKQLQTISEVLNWARIYRTATGNPVPWPTNNDTSNTGELLGENSDSSSSSADLVFGTVNFAAYKFSSKMIKSSAELIQDNGVNLPQFIGEQLGERVGKITNTYYTTGTGSSQPLGYTDGTAGFVQGFGSTASNSFAAKDLIDLQHSVDAAYRNSPKCAWAMSDLILAEIKKLSLGTGDSTPLWMPSYRDGAPDTILGKPYFINNAMATALADQAKMIYFGDWNRFVIRIVNEFTLRRLEERYAEFDQIAWVGFMRSDSKVLNRNAVKYLKCT